SERFPVAGFRATVALFAAYEFPGLEHAGVEQRKSGSNQHCAHHAPVSQGIQIVIMSEACSVLNFLRSVEGKTIIEMRWPHAKPRMILPHLQRRFPKPQTYLRTVG